MIPSIPHLSRFIGIKMKTHEVNYVYSHFYDDTSYCILTRFIDRTDHISV